MICFGEVTAMHCSLEPSLPVLVVSGMKDLRTNEPHMSQDLGKSRESYIRTAPALVQRIILLGHDQLYHPLSLRQGLLEIHVYCRSVPMVGAT